MARIFVSYRRFDSAAPDTNFEAPVNQPVSSVAQAQAHASEGRTQVDIGEFRIEKTERASVCWCTEIEP